MQLLREIALRVWDKLSEEERDELIRIGVISQYEFHPGEEESPDDDTIAVDLTIVRKTRRKPRVRQVKTSEISAWLSREVVPVLPVLFHRLPKAVGHSLDEELSRQQVIQAIKIVIREKKATPVQIFEFLTWNPWEGDWPYAGKPAHAYRAVREAWCEGFEAPVNYRWILKNPAIQQACSAAAIQAQAIRVFPDVLEEIPDEVEVSMRKGFDRRLWEYFFLLHRVARTPPVLIEAASWGGEHSRAEELVVPLIEKSVPGVSIDNSGILERYWYRDREIFTAKS